MEQIPSWKTNSHSASQEIIQVLWNLSVAKSLPLIPILSQMKPVHIITSYFSQIHSNIILQSMPVSHAVSL
jgi:hypothetical protein